MDIVDSLTREQKYYFHYCMERSMLNHSWFPEEVLTTLSQLRVEVQNPQYLTYYEWLQMRCVADLTVIGMSRLHYLYALQRVQTNPTK